MNIQGYQKISLLDYPGKVACTVFTGGCNLRCPFCHNASLVLSPNEGESMEGEVLDYLEKRKGLLDGVCVTGGEPLLQPDLIAFLRRIKALGLAVKLDTNGSKPDRLGKVLASGLVDYVAMDIKHAPEHYEQAIGVKIDASVFEESIRILKESGLPHEFRTTAVKGIHELQDFLRIAELVGNDAYFIQGFVDSGNLIGSGCSAFSAEEASAILAGVRAVAPNAKLRGQEE